VCETRSVTRGPNRERAVGGSPLRVITVARPPAPDARAYAALAPKAAVLAFTRSRRRLSAVPIAVTGSVGKTTKDLLAAALRTVGPTAALEDDHSRAGGLVRAVAGENRRTRFLVQELGAAGSGAGSLDELLWALEPEVAVVTTIRSDHHAGLGGPEGAAREKAKSVACLPGSGLAVLNADDPRVRGMTGTARCRVVLAGRTHGWS